MDVIKQIEYWIDSAKEDINSAINIFQNGNYDWSLFIGHLSLEKLLKACYVKENENIPPKIHRLDKLAESSGLSFSEDHETLLKLVNDFNISARYPDYKNRFRKICTKEFAEEYLNKIEEIFNWILEQIEN